MHLREFGAPVWILFQGPAERLKIQFKSERRLYVGFQGGSRSVLYYDAITQNVKASRNYCFLDNISDEGESERLEKINEPSTTAQPDSVANKRKQTSEDTIETLVEPWKTYLWNK